MASHQLDLALGTHRGRHRERNEDAVSYHYPENYETLNSYGALFVLADGVGGLANGAEVAELAIRRLVEIYYQEPLSTPSEMLRASIVQVNSEIYRIYHTKSATTLVAMLIRQDEAIIAHVGDSRAYHGKPNLLKLVTQDHAAEMIDPDGKARRKLTRALGYRAHLEVSISSHSLQKGDFFLLVTDGATRYFDTNTLFKLLSENPRDSVQRIIESSNEAGGYDNVSAILVKISGSLANEAALNTHLSQLGQKAVNVELPPYDEAAPQTNRLYSLLLWLTILLGFISTGTALFLFSPKPEAVLATTQFVVTQPTILPVTLAPTASQPGLLGQSLVFDVAALTYTQLGQGSSEFLIQPNEAYLVQEIFVDEDTWIRLYEPESARSGWIREADLPPYRLLN
jgi:PPM family protein phosphatase